MLTVDITDLRRRALRLSHFSIGYHVVKCSLSLLAGYLASSIALVGFGLDSLMEPSPAG